MQETWKAMEELVDQGLVKAIGVSNYSSKKLKDLLSYCRIKPAVYQGEVCTSPCVLKCPIYF